MNKFHRIAKFCEGSIQLPLTTDLEIPFGVINRTYIHCITKLPLNPNYNPEHEHQINEYDILDTDRDLDFFNMWSVAPYMDKILHIFLTKKGLKA